MAGVSATTVLRLHLLDQLSDAVHRKLTVVSALAGSGKTALLTQWAAHCKCPVIWVTCTPRDDGPVAFYQTVCRAAEELVGRGTLQTPERPDTDTTMSGEELVHRLIQVADSLRDESIFLFDNFQTIRSPVVHAALSALIARVPAHHPVVVGTREDPPLPLSLLRSQGQLLEIRGEDLAFSLAETKELLNDQLKLGLSHRDLELLRERMDGWAAGLRLAAVALQTASDIPSTLASFDGEHPFVADYFADEVLAGLPEDMRAFLLQTSIVPSFCAGLCDALTGHGRSMLRRVRRLNLCLVSLDEPGGWYRYPQCFAEVLARLLEEEGADLVRALHGRAMRWYMQYGMMRGVVRHALAAGEFQVAADVIEHQVDELIWEHGEIAGLLGWLAALPAEVTRSRPRLYLAHAWALALTGQLEALENHLAIAEQSLVPISLTGVSIPSFPLPQESSRLDPPLLGELAAVRAVAAGSQFDTIRLESSSSEVLSRDPENRFLRSVLALSRARALDIAAHVQDAILAYGEARALGETVGNAHIQVVAGSRLAELWAVRGELHQAAAAHRRVLRMAEHAPERRSAMGAMSHVGLASVLYEWNDVTRAGEEFEEGARQAMRWGHLETLKGAYFGLARVRFAQGAVDEAFDLLDEAEVLARHSNAPRSVVWVHAMQARLHLMRGNVATASHWYETSDLQPDRYQLRLYTGEYSTAIRLLIARGQYDQAQPLLEGLFHTAIVEHWMGLTIELLLLRALLFFQRGTFRAAVPSLRKALSLAAPETYLRTFLDEGPSARALLERACLQDAMPPYLDVILEAFHAERSGHARRATSTGILTPREREVLRHIAAGEANHEIAERLVLSLATVKRHVSNIFNKMQVTSRTQAAIRAREMDLL